jgi:tetrahydromethanopterin S-methyltransferase subunit A
MTRAMAADPITVVREQIANGIAATKCHPCGCFQSTVEALASSELAPALADDLGAARATFTPKKYDCLGCAECFPAIAANAVADVLAASGGLDLCPVEETTERGGWPPLAGDYHVIRYRGSVAVCALNSDDVASALATTPPAGLAIVGTMHTENLGIERVIRNVASNPNIRFLLLCGDDTQQSIGHLPGQSLESLCRDGINERRRIRGARGKRPVLKNVSPEQIAAFREQVELVPMIGEKDYATLASTIERLGTKAASRSLAVCRTWR